MPTAFSIGQPLIIPSQEELQQSLSPSIEHLEEFLVSGSHVFNGEVDNDNDVNKCSSPIDGILKFPSLMWPDSTRDMAVQGPKPQAASRSLRWRKACPLGISVTWVWPWQPQGARSPVMLGLSFRPEQGWKHMETMNMRTQQLNQLKCRNRISWTLPSPSYFFHICPEPAKGFPWISSQNLAENPLGHLSCITIMLRQAHPKFNMASFIRRFNSTLLVSWLNSWYVIL